MTPTRWPALVVVGAALAGVVVADRQFPVDSARDRAGLVLATEVSSADGLSSTWYCAAGQVGTATGADHWITVFNPTADRISAVVTVVPVAVAPTEAPEVIPGETVDADLVPAPPAAVPGPAVGTEVVVEPGDAVDVRLGDVTGAEGDHVAALVESTGGVLVTHRLEGSGPAARGECSSTAATEWHLAGGSTRDGAAQVITIFNPFPQEAIVSLTFDTPNGTRSPSAYQSLTVRAGGVIPVDVSQVAPLFDATAADISARSGRVVVERLQSTGDAASATASLALGTPRPAPQWIFAGAQVDAGVGTALVIHNPTRREARVDVELHLDPYEGAPAIEPITVTVRPERSQTVVLSPLALPVGARGVVDASTRLPQDAPVPVTYWAAIRSLNGVSVVAERIDGPAPAEGGAPGAPAVARWQPGITVSAREWAVAGGVTQLAIVNPGTEAVAIVTVRRLSAGSAVTVVEVEVPQGGRQILDLAGFELGSAPLLVTSEELVVVEHAGSDGSFRPGAPTRRTWEALELPFPQ